MAYGKLGDHLGTFPFGWAKGRIFALSVIVVQAGYGNKQHLGAKLVTAAIT